MKVIICGAGQVGWQIARHLSGERNDVTVVDSNPDLVRRATETLDVQGINGFASYPNVLDQAGARDADMIIAATYSDEVNMVTCQVAHSVFSINRKIARLRSQSYLDAIYSDLYRRDHMPIDVVISPEREVAEAALQRLAAPAAFDTETFMEGKAQLLGLRIEDDCPIVNTPLRQLTDLFSTLEVVVLAIRRDGKLFAPEAGDQLFVGDDAYVFAPAEDVPRTMEVFGKTSQSQERLVIIGGGNIGLSVAKRIEKRGKRTRVKVIERDRKVAERAADALERTIVLNGDGLDAQLLAEANISRTDAVLAVTDDDKTNMLAAVRAKAEGCPFAIALINDPTLLPMMEPPGHRRLYQPALHHRQLDPAPRPPWPRALGLFHRRRRGRGDRGRSHVHLQHRRRRHPRDRLSRRRACGGVLRDGKVLKPAGSMRIEAGDVVVIFALASDVGRVEQLLQVSIDFF